VPAPAAGKRPQRRGAARGARSSRRDPAGATIRCFVALQPDEAARDRLDALAGEQLESHAPARRMRRENLHLTLAFIGALPGERAQQVASELTLLRAEEFDWALDAVGAFAGARVLWAGGNSEPLRLLAERARRLLDSLAVPFDRKPFVPHVTLLRNLRRDALAAAGGPIDPPILWRVGAPVLLQSSTDAQGTRYTAVAAGSG
jgi:2'-5' RNA ligase